MSDPDHAADPTPTPPKPPTEPSAPAEPLPRPGEPTTPRPGEPVPERPTGLQDPRFLSPGPADDLPF